MNIKIDKRLWLYRAAFIVLGAVAGYYYWATIGCSSGTCAITSKWLNTTLYGGLLGYLVGDILKEEVVWVD